MPIPLSSTSKRALIALLAQADRHLALPGRVPEGVSHQVRRDETESLHISGGPHGTVRDLNAEPDFLDFRGRDGFLRGNGNGVPQVDGFAGASLFRFHSGQGQQVGHDGGETQGLVPGLPKKPFPGLAGHIGVVQDRFHQSLDGGDGCLEFVGDVGHEILSHGLDPQPFRDIVHHHHGAHRRLFAVSERRGFQLDGPVPGRRSDLQAGVHSPSFLKGAGNSLRDLRDPRRFPDRLAETGRGVGSQNPAGGFVHMQDAFILVDGHHSLRHAAENGQKLPVIGLKRLHASLAAAGHPVECVAQLSDLVRSRNGEALSVVAPGHGLGDASHGKQGPEQASSHQQPQNQGHHRHGHGAREDRLS